MHATCILEAHTKRLENKVSELCETLVNKQYENIYGLLIFDWLNGFSRPQSKSREKIPTFNKHDMQMVSKEWCEPLASKDGSNVVLSSIEIL